MTKKNPEHPELSAGAAGQTKSRVVPQSAGNRSRALKLGLPIGSGIIASGPRHALQARLKKAGTAWIADHADQIANLRALRANGQWLNFWN